jgi:putative tryptophan/tyrosine transport system substrate-binding protein
MRPDILVPILKLRVGPMKRREFITLVTGAAIAGPRAAQAQQDRIPTVGFLSGASAATATYFAEFLHGLNDAGFVEGLNIAIEPRWAEGQYDQMPALVAELVRRPLAVFVAASLPALLAAKAATSTIPIVFMTAGDPVQLGFVASLNRPGGNMTGVSFLGVELMPKRLELLLELVPKASVIGILKNPVNPKAELEIAEARAAAHTIGKEIVIAKASRESDFDAAFAALVRERAGGLLVAGEPLSILKRERLIALAERYALPAIYEFREFTAAGGFLSYGFSLADGLRLVAGQVAQILNGAKPADLPVLQPTRFELVINLKTARLLGLTVPPLLLARADGVIE